MFNVSGPWPGRVFVAARPRGGDWLDDDISRSKQCGIDVVLSLLTAEEERELGLETEAIVVESFGMEFVSLPIEGRGVPASEGEFLKLVQEVARRLGIGRAWSSTAVKVWAERA